MCTMRKFEEKAVQTGCHSIIKDAEKYASELHLFSTSQHSLQGTTESLLWRTGRREMAGETD